ncbi:EF-P 5-aminopentanol modification-associated protein YfmH [Dethiothermospora halolimnae]|uniref:EF-P 5-aminopentanol modification-associated protein YfmH n=1 Tax=Dethiothermospora halolimnae TaxID=3114390 RepID=UPI003CCC02DD
MNKIYSENKRLEEKIYLRELDNGLKIFFMPKEGYTKKHAIYATNYGSNDNKFIPLGESDSIEVPEGIAHFLEHKLFEQPEGNIFNEFSQLGSYVNAFTNYNQTAYLFSCTDKFYENLDLLIKFVQSPYFTDDSVEKEKGIIEQEIRMYDDSPRWRVFSNCLSGLYKEYPVRVDIAGTVESIKEITKEDLYKCYNTFYNPKNMILFIIGDIDFDKALNIIEKHQNPSIDNGIIKRFYPKEPREINESLIETNLSVSTPLFNIGFKDLNIGFGGTRLIEKEMVTNILLDLMFGDSTEFYNTLYDKGLINKSFGAQYVGNKGYGHTIIGGESENPKRILNEILNHLKSIKESGLLKDDFNRVKNKMMGYYIMDFNSIESVASSFISKYYNGASILDYLSIIEDITLNDIMERLNEHLTADNYTLSIVKPS